MEYRVRLSRCYIVLMANCVTCGRELHPERAEKYDYCTEPECRERNARGLDVVAVGVNKAADQFVVLDERTKREMASGRYKKQPEVPASLRVHSRARTVGSSKPAASPPGAKPSRPEWSDAQENLALIYRRMGMKPNEIAQKLGVTDHLVTRILLAATARGRR
jgi:hypothetical protein